MAPGLLLPVHEEDAQALVPLGLYESMPSRTGGFPVFEDFVNESQ